MRILTILIASILSVAVVAIAGADQPACSHDEFSADVPAVFPISGFDTLILEVIADPGAPCGHVHHITDVTDPTGLLVVIPDPANELATLNLDASIMIQELSMLVQQRQRLLDSLNNVIRSSHDAQMNTVRRIV